MQPPTYIAVEKGDRLAKSEEIVKLASFLGRKVNELVRPTEPVVDLQPHLRAAAEKMKEADREALNAAIDELQRLAEDYRDLEKLIEPALALQLPPGSRAQPPHRRRGTGRESWPSRSGSGSGWAISR